MSDATPRDLTRWNRAGLSRFTYVDGNAAVWLDEVRLSMLARYLRGVTGEARGEGYWRDLFARPLVEQDISDIQSYYGKLAWKALFEQLPAKPETARRRNERLLALYAKHSPDQAHEIMRAFARAAHVLLGHVDAFANEGYLRTATQWDSMRKLAAMIGYQPTPGAAASTVVALIVEAGLGRTEIERGVAMSFTPPGGGKPVVFETVETIDAHPALNAARARGHDRNMTKFDPTAPNRYAAPKNAAPKAGDVVVLVSDTNLPVPFPTLIATAALSDDKTIAKIDLEGTQTATWIKHSSVLLAKPEKVLKVRPRTFGSIIVIEVLNFGMLQAGTVVFLTDASGSEKLATVKSAADGRVELEGAGTVSGSIQITLANQYSVTNGYVATPDTVDKVWFKTSGGFLDVVAGTTEIAGDDMSTKSGMRKIDGKIIDVRFQQPSDAQSIGYTKSGTVAHVAANVVAASPPVSDTYASTTKTVEFVGKPSSGLVAGTWFVARNASVLKALRVEAVRVTPDSHFVAFEQDIIGSPSDYEFHGPMTLTYRPEDYDHGQNAVFSGGIILEDIDAAAQKLVKVGRKIIVEDEREDGKTPVLLTIASMLDGAGLVGSGAGDADEVKVTFVESPSELDGLISGWTVFRLNTSRATHGETRGAKTLGSGNAEKFRQTFNLAVKDITFIPSSAAESGVAPDIDIAVQDVLWAYRDLSDPAAEGSDCWSVGLREDDTLDILFRRRLPTGNNNVAVTRHRVGTGPAGNAVPAYGFVKPAKKHRFVTAIAQPFAAAGGAEREPVSSMRESAPSRLSANGRAVSLKDFEKLASRHASVWQARAEQLPEVGAAIRLIIVAAYGGAVDQAFSDILSGFILSHAIPGVRLEIAGFVAVPVRIEATVRVDIARYDKTDVADASLAALADTFTLRRRGLGQSFLIGEILAALEVVEGVETAVATLTLDASAPAMTRPPLSFPAGGLSAIYPDGNQVAYVTDAGALTLHVEAV